MSERATQPANETVVQAVMDRLFADSTLNTFVILDGAAIPDLLPKLDAEGPEHVCLYRGELEPDMAECAPYLVRLVEGSPFTQWVVTEGWGNHWGVFVLAATDINTLRRHFRGFLLVMSPAGKRLYFRYYDPRVLRKYLPTCNVDEGRTIFGPVKCYLAEDEDSSQVLRFTPDKNAPRKEMLPLASR